MAPLMFEISAYMYASRVAAADGEASSMSPKVYKSNLSYECQLEPTASLRGNARDLDRPGSLGP